MYELFAFCKLKSASESDYLVSLPGYKAVFVNKASGSGELVLFIYITSLLTLYDGFCFLFDHHDYLYTALFTNNECVMVKVMQSIPRPDVRDFM